jgi:hypothetical protein
MDEATYWKARYVLLEMLRASDVAEAVRAAAVQRAGEIAKAKLDALGVPWAPGYRWDDTALSITPVLPGVDN